MRFMRMCMEEVMKAAGIEAEMHKSKQKEYTEYVVRIPNKSA